MSEEVMVNINDKNSPSIPSYELLYEYFQKRVRDIFERYWWHGYLIRSIHTCIDDESSFLENDKTINDLNLEDLLGQLKTQAFSLSDIITNAINKKEEGVALDYALINDIKYKMIIVKVLSCIIFLKAPISSICI
ncbi:hypothetical protein RGC59_04540 [Helicobacter pylori]|nr:hypothetical protein [Helicobacter pylori]MDZ5288070.1 hypothetical protein [Helicobacter pylori]